MADDREPTRVERVHAHRRVHSEAWRKLHEHHVKVTDAARQEMAARLRRQEDKS